MKKNLGYFSIENIDDHCVAPIAVNPKEYHEIFKSEKVNKKHKGLRKGAQGMDFKVYSKRINSTTQIETFGNLPTEKQKACRFKIKNNNMVLQEIEKLKLAQINNKRYYFSDEIVSLPFCHPYLHEIFQFKSDKKQKL